jgi:hypothetical protein
VALTLHTFGSSFGSEGPGSGQFKEPEGVAVSEVGGSAGDVYVVDKGNDRVEIFNAAGTTVLAEFNGVGSPTGVFEEPQSIAVDNSTNPLDPSAGDVYVIDRGHKVVDKFSPTGTYEGQITTGAEGVAFGTLNGVAVDPNGLLWVYQASAEIDDYTDALANVFIASRVSSFCCSSPGLAVDSNDDLFIKKAGPTIAEIDSSAKEVIEEMDEESSSSVAVDPTSQNILVDNVSNVAVFKQAPSCVLHRCRFSPPGTLVERFGSGDLSEGRGVAVSGSTGVVYVVDRAANAVKVFTPIFIPDALTGSATNIKEEGSATLNGTVDPHGGPLTACTFEYGTDSSYGSSVPCEQALATIKSREAVSANVSGLTPGTLYHFRLVAADANGENDGEDGVFVIPAPPVIESESSFNVGSTTATVDARINPGGLVTAYRVEYGTGEHDLSTPEVSVGSGLQAAAVQVQLSGLQAGSAYHFRFVAKNALSTTMGNLVGFTTPQSLAAVPLGLPDNRTYELVSPATGNQNVYFPDTGENGYDGHVSTVRAFRASADGGSVVYAGEPPAEGGNGQIGNGLGNQFFATRGSTGWTVRDITPPGMGIAGSEPEFRYFSDDLSLGVLSLFGPLASGTPSAPPGCTDLYSLTAGTGAYRALFTTSQLAGSTSCLGTFPAGASADHSHVLFEAGGIINQEVTEQTGGKAAGAGNLYDSAGGKLYLVNVLPDGQPEPTPTASLGSPRAAKYGFPGLDHAVSASGSRIFWSSVEIPEGYIEEVPPFSPEALYVRENDTQPQSPIGPEGKCSVVADACTVQVDAGEPGCVAEAKCGSGGGVFWTASADGSRVFFTDCKKLTADSTADPTGCAGPDLYEYDVDTARLVDLTVDHNPGDPLGAAVNGVVGASEDGSYVYFAAGGVLAPNATATPGQVNFYVRHDGVNELIATGVDGGAIPPLNAIAAERYDWAGSLGERTAEVSADGHAVAFDSTTPLTGYENGGLREAFVYDALTKRLSCASCNPDGAPPSGTEKEFGYSLGGYLPTSSNPTFMQRFISADGSRVFFDTKQALVSQDTNGLLDVYEWERNGTGTCTTPAPGGAETGCIYLLSGGDGADGSYLVDADATGENVFFASRDKLVSRAHNESVALYDARVNGGFPETSLACTGTGCQGVPPAPPIFATPSSTTFTGVGNFAPPGSTVAKLKKAKIKQCRRGRVRKRNKCVKRKAGTVKHSSTRTGKRGK